MQSIYSFLLVCLEHLSNFFASLLPTYFPSFLKNEYVAGSSLILGHGDIADTQISSWVGVESSGGIVREGLFEEVILELRPELERGSHL